MVRPQGAAQEAGPPPGGGTSNVIGKLESLRARVLQPRTAARSRPNEGPGLGATGRSASGRGEARGGEPRSPAVEGSGERAG